MLIVFFSAALLSGGLTAWLLWPYGLLVALGVAAIVASAVVVAVAAIVAIAHSRVSTGEAGQPRGILDLLGLRPPR